MDKNGFFSFSAGCAINLDDIGQFPDYHQVAQQLQENLAAQKIDNKNVKVFLEAQLEDIQHVPNFHNILIKLIYKHQLLQQKLHQLLEILALKTLLSYFTTFSMEQKQYGQIIKFLSSKINGQIKINIMIDFYLAVVQIASYAQQHEQIVNFFFKTMSEEQMMLNDELFKKYLKIIDKFLRFRNFRKLFQKHFDNENNLYTTYPLLGLKLSLWNDPQQMKKNCSQILAKYSQSSKNPFIHQYLQQSVIK